VAIASIGYAGCLFGQGQLGIIPDIANLGIILGGWFLLGGAMAVAWTEKNFYSEHAYDYHTMESLFQHATFRIQSDLDKLGSLAAFLAQPRPDLADLNERHQEFDAGVAEVQEFLYSLGKEALDENAEWLFLHRSRPLEPVMAG
jgi:hypothetical protein